jgi:hypothetical protein
MSTSSVKEFKPDYNELAWLGQQIYNGISAVATAAGKVASAALHALELGEHAASPEILQYSEPPKFDYPPSPSKIKLGNPPSNWVRPTSSFTRVARAQKILPQINEEGRLYESHQACYQTSTDAVLNELFVLQDGNLVSKNF